MLSYPCNRNANFILWIFEYILLWFFQILGVGGPWQEGKFIDPCVAKIEFGKAGEVENITKKLKGIVSWVFPKEKSLAEYNPESIPPYSTFYGGAVEFSTLW